MKKALFSIFIALVFVNGANGQKSGISGRLYDWKGDLIPGVEVVVSNQSGKVVGIGLSNSDGEFAVDVPKGRYRLETGGGKSGFCKVAFTNYQVATDQFSMRLDILLAYVQSSHGKSRCPKKVIEY